MTSQEIAENTLIWLDKNHIEVAHKRVEFARRALYPHMRYHTQMYFKYDEALDLVLVRLYNEVV